MAPPGPGDNPAVPEHPCHKGFTVKLESRLNRKRNLLDLDMELTDFWRGIVLWTVLLFFFFFFGLNVLSGSGLTFLSH